MPKRTRKQILEDESWKHFNDLIPNNWVIRKPDPDYGIDAEVEIFSKDGESTGLIFFVQLKATDQKRISKALKLTFKKDMLRYYYKLELPVLIARYHSPSKSIFIRWAHSIDLYYSEQNTMRYTINFTEDSRWGKDTPKLINKYLEQFRNYKKALPLPIELLLQFDVQFSDNTYPLKLESQLNAMIKDQRLPIRLTSKKKSDISAKLIVAPTEIKITILEKNTFVMHNMQNENGKYDESKLHYDLVSIVGCSFFVTNRKSIALQILEKNLPNSSLINSMSFLSLLASFIESEKDFNTAISLMENILETDRRDKIGIANNVFMLVISQVHLRFGCPKNVQRRFADVLLRLCNEMEANGDKKAASINYYNLANAMRGSNLFSEKKIISWYKNAARLWKEYMNREYFWAEIGGVLFNCNKYLCSSRFYKKAIKIKEKIWTIALCADALLFAGRYRESLDFFANYLQKEKNPEAEWVLKAFLLEYLVEFSSIEIQARLKEEARNLASIDLKNAMSSKEAALENISKLEKICKKDLLCSMMWANIANLYNYVGEKEKAFYAGLVVCIMEPHNIEAWFACLIYGAKIKSPVLGSIGFLAYEKNGEELINFFVNKFESKPGKTDPELVAILKMLFDEIREYYTAHARKEFSVVRLFKDKNSYKEIKMRDVHRS